MPISGATGDPYNWNTTGPAGVSGATGSISVGATGSSGPTGPVGVTHYDPVTGQFSINTGSNWTITPAQTGAATWANNSTYAYTTTYQPNSDVIIKRPGKEDIAVGKTLEAIMDRLCIITPAMELIEKYPALREAYENYKTIEAMVMHGDDNDEVG